MWDKPARHWSGNEARCRDPGAWVWTDVVSLRRYTVFAACEVPSVVKIPSNQTGCDTTHKVMCLSFQLILYLSGLFPSHHCRVLSVYSYMLWRLIVLITVLFFIYKSFPFVEHISHIFRSICCIWKLLIWFINIVPVVIFTVWLVIFEGHCLVCVVPSSSHRCTERRIVM